MTELDAYPISRIDQDAIGRRAAKARGPDEILRIVSAFILHRMSGLEHGDNPKVKEFAQQSFAHHAKASSSSQALVLGCERLLRGLEKAFAPEDMQSLLLYLVGSEATGAGVIQFGLSLIRDNDMKEGAEHIQKFAQEMRARLDGESAALWGPEGQIRLLPIGLQEWVRSLLLEARHAFSEKDGESSRNAIVQARRIVKRFAPAADAAA